MVKRDSDKRRTIYSCSNASANWKKLVLQYKWINIKILWGGALRIMITPLYHSIIDFFIPYICNSCNIIVH